MSKPNFRERFEAFDVVRCITSEEDFLQGGADLLEVMYEAGIKAERERCAARMESVLGCDDDCMAAGIDCDECEQAENAVRYIRSVGAP